MPALLSQSAYLRAATSATTTPQGLGFVKVFNEIDCDNSGQISLLEFFNFFKVCSRVRVRQWYGPV